MIFGFLSGFGRFCWWYPALKDFDSLERTKSSELDNFNSGIAPATGVSFLVCSSVFDNSGSCETTWFVVLKIGLNSGRKPHLLTFKLHACNAHAQLILVTGEILCRYKIKLKCFTVVKLLINGWLKIHLL